MMNIEEKLGAIALDLTAFPVYLFYGKRVISNATLTKQHGSDNGRFPEGLV